MAYLRSFGDNILEIDKPHAKKDSRAASRGVLVVLPVCHQMGGGGGCRAFRQVGDLAAALSLPLAYTLERPLK